MGKLRIEWSDFQLAADASSTESLGYLDRETGAVYVVSQETSAELEALLADADPDTPAETVIAEADLPDCQREALLDAWQIEELGEKRLIDVSEVELRDDYRDLADFAATVQDPTLRRELERAIQGSGAFRRFRDIVHGTFREPRQWFAFQQQRQQEKVAAWLAGYDIEVEWVMPVSAPDEPRLFPREHLLAGVLQFTSAAAPLPGVKRIALLGSLTRTEPEPKDADVLVTVSDTMDLAALAKVGRKLAGHAQQLNRGADVFLANEHGQYIGRTCHWRECGPGIRAICDALHCGRRTFLHDDLGSVTLAADLVAKPPIDLWPQVIARTTPPEDVERILLSPLRANRNG